MRRILPLVLALLMCLASIDALHAAPNMETKKLHKLFEVEWDYQMEQFPTVASMLGDRRWNDRWPDWSPEAINARQEHRRRALAMLESINRRRLSASDRLNFDLLKREIEIAIEEHGYRWYLVPLNQLEGVQTADDLGNSLRFESVKDYSDWIARLRALPVLIEQTIGLMREGIQARILQPRQVLERITEQIEKQIVADPARSPFYKPFTRISPDIPAADRDRLISEARTAIAGSVVPAFRRLRDFFAGSYLPASFDKVGIWQAPNGEALYEFLARKYTTTNLSAKEIHQIGLDEVKRIRSEMEAIIQRVGFKGTFAEFLTFLRTDQQFYYKTPDELLNAYRSLAKRVDPQLVKVFKTLPRLPYGVEPIPDHLAPDNTTAYYRQPAADGSRAGTYFVNLYKPETRPRYEMMALSLHEAVPGHHLQIALAMEQGGLPKFRRYGMNYTAFVEGWGLYAESLGEEMGLYDDPYAKFGQLTYEMWRAVRLVVDTGIHVFRWERQRAISFFLENAAKTELDVVNEIDRYISWPGQALAYKIGELKIKDLRSKANRLLGDRFDLRDFHDVVLGSGAIPLDILEARVNRWIQTARRQQRLTIEQSQ